MVTKSSKKWDGLSDMSTKGFNRTTWNKTVAMIRNAFGPNNHTSTLEAVREYYDRMVQEHGLRVFLNSELFLKFDYFPEKVFENWSLGLSVYITEDYKIRTATYLGRVDLDNSEPDQLLLHNSDEFDILVFRKNPDERDPTITTSTL